VLTVIFFHQLAAANQRTQLESLISQLKATLSDTEARVTDLTFTVQDDVQARAFLAESIACIARIHRTVTKDDEAGSNAGIGISVRMEKDFCVVKALDESAAGKDSRAMLPHTIQVGHVIESVDGQAVRGLGKNAVQDMLVGPVGTDVSVGARGTGEGDVPYIVTLKRFAKEDSLRSVSERTVDVCARTSRFLHDIESLKAELSAMSVDLQRKEEMLTESVRAREASNKQLLGLEEREKFFQSEKDGLQAQIDVLNMQLASSKEQVVELDGRNEKNTEIISFSQKKIFDLENTISELDKDKQRLSDVVAKLEQQTKNMKAELLSSQARYATELQNMEGEVEKLHAQLLKQGRTAALLMDAEKREMILKRSLETYEQERNTYKRESALLGSDLKTARSSLEERANDLTATQQDLNSTRQRISEVEAMCKELQDAAAAATKSRQECASQLQDARLKTRLLLDAMKGAVSQWQGVGMVVRSGGPGKPITIKDLRPGGSAWRSGVLNDGDFLVAVDGKNVSGMEVREIQALILGPEGTTVNVVARSSRGGRNFSVDLVRGDGAKAEQSWDDEVKDAIDAATAMHAEGQSIREVVRGLVQETKRRDADVEMTLRTVENSFEDARLSWQDVSSSLLSFTARQTPRKTSDAVEADSLARDVGEIQFNSNVVVAVQTNTIKSKASLARISELALESLRQISDGVKIRQDLQRQLASLDKTRGDQQLLEEEMARMRADCEARMRGLKSDNASLAARLAEAEREVQAAKVRAIVCLGTLLSRCPSCENLHACAPMCLKCVTYVCAGRPKLATPSLLLRMPSLSRHRCASRRMRCFWRCQMQSRRNGHYMRPSGSSRPRKTVLAWFCD
jgi:C-terminal processing protease CtpA/Prc